MRPSEILRLCSKFFLAALGPPTIEIRRTADILPHRSEEYGRD
jgi:hypothetical protein